MAVDLEPGPPAREPGRAAIHAEGVTKSYAVGRGSIDILHGVSLSVGYGEMVAVMGPSGSGKSTLLYCLAGLEEPTTGQVSLNGRSLASCSRADLARMRRREVGFVFQSYNLIPTLTAFENVALPYRLRRERPPIELIEQTLAGVGLTDRSQARPPSMSGGEQQRVALARVLAQQPRIVFADEPTGALDTRSGTVVLAELQRIAHQADQCVLVVTHDPAVAAQCDRIVFLKDGLLERELEPSSVDEVAAVLAELSREQDGSSVPKLLLAELRDSWSAWLGVCLGFILTNFSLALAALVELAGVRAVQSGQMDLMNSASFTWGPAFNIVLCTIVGAVLIGSSTSLVVDSRRGSLARLSLGGATPGQVVLTIMSQLVAVSLLCAVIGDVLAYALLDPTMTFLLATDNNELLMRAEPIYAVWPVLLANVFAVGLALVGGWKQARRASRIPPVEALRHSRGGSDDRMTIGRWLKAGLALLVILGTYAAIGPTAAATGKEGFSNAFQAAAVMLVVCGALLGQIAPLVVGPLTRAWTRLVPSFDATWDLTRSTTIVKAARLSKTVVPVMMTIGLFFGMTALAGTMQATLYANGNDISIGGLGAKTMIPLLGLPLLLALSGGVGSLIMMSKQRDAELALSGIVGTTPGQRLLMPVLEGVVIAVTAALMSLVMVAVSVGVMAIGVPAAGLVFAFRPSYSVFAGGFGVCVLITVAATLLPTVASLRTPEPRVIARLVAE